MGVRQPAAQAARVGGIEVTGLGTLWEAWSETDSGRRAGSSAAAGQVRNMVFGKRGIGFGGWSKYKNRLDARIATANGSRLRRGLFMTFGARVVTHMAEIGVQPHIIEAVINHASGHKSGVAGIYNRASYEAEKRTALNRWAAHLAAIFEGSESNVTPLRSA
jgi:hypothetical protein